MKSDKPGNFFGGKSVWGWGVVAAIATAAVAFRPIPNGRAAESATAEAKIGEVTAAGKWLAEYLDKLDVEHHWLRSRQHVAWRSGIPLDEVRGKQLTPLQQDETHCSAFAAAAADGLGIYLLHPPEHSHVLLSNAQYDWLPSAAGRRAGWTPVDSPLEAQRLANGGNLVVAVFKNLDVTLAGHVAVVRPSPVKAARIAAKGPQVIQAGSENFKTTNLETGFIHHPGGWLPGGKGSVRFYMHPIDRQKLAGE